MDRLLVLSSWIGLIWVSLVYKSWLLGIMAFLYIPILLLLGAIWYINLNRDLIPHALLIFSLSTIMMILAILF